MRKILKLAIAMGIGSALTVATHNLTFATEPDQGYGSSGAHGVGASVHLAAANAESGIQKCGDKFEGQSAPLNDCVADELDKLADKLEKNQVDRAIPETVKIVRRAARQVRRKRTKRPAISVLRKARAAIRRLAARSGNDVKRGNTRVAQVLTVAINVIRTKGGA